MSQSNAPGETVHRGKNACRLIITLELEFPETVVKNAAPTWDKTALTMVRNMLNESLRFTIIELMHKNVASLKRPELIHVKDIIVEAAP